MAIIDLETRKPLMDTSELNNDTLYAASEIRMNPSNGLGGDPHVSSNGITRIGKITDGNESQSGEAFNSMLNELSLPPQSADDETKSNGKWAPKELRPRHREMMRRILEGATQVEIAEEMGLSTQAVMLVCSSAMFKEELRLLEEELNLNVIQRAEDLSNEALDKLKMLMRKARSEALQASCAERVLGIAGYSKIEKKQVQVISGADVIRELNRKRREAAEQRTNGDTGQASPKFDSTED
jgi:hypothetical protein